MTHTSHPIHHHLPLHPEVTGQDGASTLGTLEVSSSQSLYNVLLLLYTLQLLPYLMLLLLDTLLLLLNLNLLIMDTLLLLLNLNLLLLDAFLFLLNLNLPLLDSLLLLLNLIILTVLCPVAYI